MSISIRSTQLQNLLSAIPARNPKKFVLIVALGGLSAATAFWLFNKYNNKRKQKPKEAIITTSDKTETIATLLTMTELESDTQQSSNPIDNLTDRISELSIKEKPTIEITQDITERTIYTESQEQMASVIQRQSIQNSTINQLEINTALDERPNELHISPTTSTSDKKSFDDFPHSPSFNWAEAVDNEMKKESVEQINSQKNSKEKLQNQRKNSQQNFKTNLNDTANSHNGTRVGYKNAESPSNSEGSADSGRATGGLTSSPFDLSDLEIPPMYEFEIPNTLVGLIIGVGANVKMLIRPHHTPSKYETHQICSVEGKRENINKCLHLIKGRFPKERFADLNLKPVLPPPITPIFNPVHHLPTALTLAVGVPCEVYVSATVDAGHFFTQLPTHPSFSSLQLLDYYMLNVYSSQTNNIPELPKPCTGSVCAAPAYNGWFRAMVLYYYEEQDEALVKYVDYGGFARTSHWSDEANAIFQKLCSAKIIQAELVGTNKHDNLPAVELYVVDESKKVLRVDQVLLEEGLAKPADPTRIIRLSIPTSKNNLKDSTKTNVKNNEEHSSKSASQS